MIAFFNIDEILHEIKKYYEKTNAKHPNAMPIVFRNNCSYNHQICIVHALYYQIHHLKSISINHFFKMEKDHHHRHHKHRHRHRSRSREKQSIHVRLSLSKIIN